MVTFTTQILDCHSYSPVFLLILAFILQWLLVHSAILILLLSQFPFTFLQYHKSILLFFIQLLIILMMIC